MLRTSKAIISGSFALGLCQVQAQPATGANQDLKSTLLGRGDAMMAAWKKHDAAGIASTFAPDFIYVGAEGISMGADTTVKTLMNCALAGYSVEESALKQVSPTVAILITRQKQQLSCFGHPAPPVMNMSDTYVKRNGKWVILLHTEVAVQTH